MATKEKVQQQQINITRAWCGYEPYGREGEKRTKEKIKKESVTIASDQYKKKQKILLQLQFEIEVQFFIYYFLILIYFSNF